MSVSSVAAVVASNASAVAAMLMLLLLLSLLLLLLPSPTKPSNLVSLSLSLSLSLKNPDLLSLCQPNPATLTTHYPPLCSHLIIEGYVGCLVDFLYFMVVLD